jgi:translation initiation factor IF-3
MTFTLDMAGTAAMSFLLQQQLQHKWRCSAISESLVNGQVRFREVRLIGTDGEQLGIMSSQDALKIAEEAELDLVCISPMAKPPVCKIIDYGKYRYEMIRRDKEAKKKQKIVELKEVRLSPNIDTNDLATKTNAARKFLEKGNKVKVTLRFRGREMSHMNQSRYILDDFAKSLADIAVIDKPSKVEGRTLVMFMSAKKN